MLHTFLASQVDTLQQRYARDKVYTYCGTILVALNPYKSIADKAYTMSIMAQYRDKPIGEVTNTHQLKRVIVVVVFLFEDSVLSFD